MPENNGSVTTLLSQFLHACGAFGPFTVNLEDPATSGALTLEFAQPFVRIGRRPNMDLRLDHWQVSRRHAYLQVLAGRVVWVDLGSRTGTYAEGQPGPSGWLSSERGIWVGPYSLKLGTNVLDGPPLPNGVSPLSARAANDLELPKVTLEFPEAGASKSVWKMRPALALVGGSATCRVRFLANSPEYVSSLVRTASGLWVVDLMGQGVLVNGSSVRLARLEEGDIIEIGRRLIRVHYETSPDPIPLSTDLAETSALLVSRPFASSLAVSQTSNLDSNRSGDLSDEHPIGQYRHPIGSFTLNHDGMTPPVSSSGELAAVTLGAPGSALAPISNVNHPLLQPMMRQFSMMQQEMMDQFQEAMLAMMHAFGDLYREQMGDLRKEMDEVRQLTEELRDLQAQSQATASDLATSATAIAAAAAAASRPSFTPRSIVPAANLPAPPKGPQSVSEPNSRPKQVPRADAADHAEISRRIAEIQQERQTRLQSIMGRLLGRPIATEN